MTTTVYEVYTKENKYDGYFLENEKQLATEYAKSIGGYAKESKRYYPSNN